MSARTPGSWSRDKYGHIVDRDGRDVLFRGVSRLGDGSEWRIAEAEANTTLAATAPDLLEALQAMLEVETAFDSECAEEKARAAIAKATSGAT